MARLFVIRLSHADNQNCIFLLTQNMTFWASSCVLL